MCAENKNLGESSVVPDFSTVGFEQAQTKSLTAAHANLKDVKALKLSACVGASYNSSTNQICFTIPIYGEACVTSPVKIPVSASLKACVETCGSIIPTGVKATIYLDNNPIYSGTIFGSC